MGKFIVNTGTITYALRGRDTLRKYGYSAYMFRKTGKGSVGCGYSIAVTSNSKKEIIDLFHREGVKFISINDSDRI